MQIHTVFIKWNLKSVLQTHGRKEWSRNESSAKTGIRKWDSKSTRSLQTNRRVRLPYNLPNSIKDTDAGEAFKEGKSLLVSGHVKNNDLFSNSNICYCFGKGLCHPEEKLGLMPKFMIWWMNIKIWIVIGKNMIMIR